MCDAAEEQRYALRRLALQEVAGGAGPDGLQQVLVRPGGREHDNLALGRCLANLRQRSQPVHAGHREVEQNELRAKPAGLNDRFLAVGRLPDDVEAVLPQERRKSLAGKGMIVGDQDALHTGLIGSTPPAE